MRRIREAGSRKSVRRGLIAALLAIPVVFIATTMPMQAMGNPVSPATSGGAFLSLGQEDNPDPATEGDQVTYAVTVGVDPEQSTDDATNVVVYDYLSPDVSFVDAEADFADCAYDSEQHLVTCDFGNMFEDESQTAYITVQTTDSCTGGGDLRSFALSEPCTIYNDVYAYADNATNSGTFDEEATTVNPASGPNLHITKSDSPDPVQELNPLTYTIDVTNDGDAGATQTVVSDHLPPGTSFVSSSTTQGSCSHTATVVTCHLGTLAVSGSGATVTIVVQAPNVSADTVIENAAGVTASNADSADTTADTTVLASDGESASGNVPPNSKTPLTFTTGTQSSNGQTAVTGTDKTAVSIVVPKGGPGGNVSLNELPCQVAPCTGPFAAKDVGAQAAAAPTAGKLVLGGVVYDVVPPPNYPNSKPFRVIMLWDKTLNATKSPVFYFKEGVTPTEITLAHCGQTPPNSGKPCVISNAKITTGPAIIRGDWKVAVRINSDPRMRK